MRFMMLSCSLSLSMSERAFKIFFLNTCFEIFDFWMEEEAADVFTEEDPFALGAHPLTKTTLLRNLILPNSLISKDQLMIQEILLAIKN